MIAFPSSLGSTTLGDLLGAIFRARANGSLELVETHGRTHRVHVAEGQVTAVDVDRAVPSLAEMLRREEVADEDTLRRSLLRAMASQRLHGEVLVTEFRVSKDVVDRALRKQIITRLSVLDQLSEARISFRVTVRAPRGALLDAPLHPREYLHGRKRARDRMHDDAPSSPRPFRSAMPNNVPDREHARAYMTLGVPIDADAIAIKTAYRRLVREYHPDLHPGAPEHERHALAQRFAAVTKAYKRLVA